MTIRGRKHWNVFEELFLVNEHGRELAYASRTELSLIGNHRDVIENGVFRLASETGEVTYSDIQINRTTGEPVITVAVPRVRIRDSSITHVMIAVIRFKSMWDIVAEFSSLSSTTVYIVDSANRVIAHSNPSIVLGGQSYDIPEIDGSHDGISDTRVILVSVPLKLGNVTLRVVAETPVAQAMSFTYQTLIIIGIFSLFALIVAGVSGFFFIRKFIQPIQVLSSTADAITHGEVEKRVPVLRNDEIGVLGRAFNEMTERLQKTIAALKQRVEERDKAIQELHRSNEELEQFAYVASHDLQEPLRKITSFIELFVRKYSGEVDKKADTYIQHIVEGTKRMQQLITDLLEYSRIGRSKTQLVRVGVREIVNQVLLHLEFAISQNNAVVILDRLPHVVTNPLRLGQLFQNLMANAIKFRSEESPVIRISAERKNDEWLFTVKDNGIGIEKKYLEQIFGIFQRLHPRSAYPGTGIGLAVCKKIVEYLGGRIWVVSTPEAGSAFSFTLPVKKGG